MKNCKSKRIVRNKHGKLQIITVTQKSKESFIEQARRLWGDRYDYTDSVYEGGKKHIIIYCPKHDYHFRVTMAQNHVMKPNKAFRPTGCPICQYEKQYGVEYGPEWRDYLEPTPNQNRVRSKTNHHNLPPEEKERCKAERAAKFEAARQQRKEQRALQVEQERQQRIEDRRKQFASNFAEKMKQLYPDITFNNMPHRLTSKVKATCHKHGEIEHDAKWWLDGKGCEYCNGKFFPPEWKDIAIKRHGNKYEYVGEPPRTMSDYIRYICKDHGLQKQRFDIHVSQGCGCPKCANYPNKKKPLERCNEFIAKCIEKYGEDRYDYSRVHEDYVNNDSLVWIRCCIHNKWFQTTPDNNLRTVIGSCPICVLEFKESEGEAKIRRWLVNHGIFDFKQDEVTIEHHNPRCKRQYLRPDFWLPGYNLFIEFNGQQHYEDVYFFYTDKNWTFEDQQIRDQTLRDFCKKHGYKLLEIPYWDIKNIDEILEENI